MSKRKQKKNIKPTKTTGKTMLPELKLTIAQGIQLAKQSIQAGELQQAQYLCQNILRQAPNYVEVLNLLGAINLKEKVDVAIEWFKKAIAIQKDNPKLYFNLGEAYLTKRQFAQASQCFQQALDLDASFTPAYQALTQALIQLGIQVKQAEKLTQAIDYFHQALSLNPDSADGHYQLAQVLKDKGFINEAIAHYRQGLQIQPVTWAYHNFLHALHYSPDFDAVTIFFEHQQFAKRFATPLATSIQPHHNDTDSQRKLRIGYISQDFRQVGVARFIEAFLAHHDRQQFEIFCYYNHPVVDEKTQSLQQYADYWNNCFELSDEALVEKIRQDRIDILVDMMGHTAAKNRLLAYARKPAPVQVAYLGYSDTTGLTTIDYRITDGYTDPEGIADSFSSETLVRLPGSYFCYQVDIIDNVAINILPVTKNGYITFGSFNIYFKLSDEILAIWANVLHAVPNSKLLLKLRSYGGKNQTYPLETQQTFESRFAQLGINTERLIFQGYVPDTEYLNTYQQVDIALDSYPFNGATTTCETVWMGVPVVTLVGDTHVARMGYSILSALGLTELIAHTPEEYVDICVKLANNFDQLQKWREEMRDNMRASPLMDAPNFTRQLESAYRKMWEHWCITQRLISYHPSSLPENQDEGSLTLEGKGPLGEDNPLITVIIPNYNNAQYLPTCLNSVLTQTFTNIEIVVVDDCSTDDSVNILREYEQKDPRLRVIIHTENQGVARARHQGILAAQGEYMTTLDSDDVYLDATKLEQELNILLKYKHVIGKDVIAFSDIVFLDEAGNPLKTASQLQPVKQGPILNEVISRQCMIPRDFLCHKSFYFEVGGYDPSFAIYEDWDLKIRLAAKYEYYYTNLMAIGYRRHGQGLSNVSSQDNVYWLQKVFAKNIPLVDVALQPTIEQQMGQFISGIARTEVLNRCEPMTVAIFGVGRSGTTAIYHLLQEIMDKVCNPLDFVYEPFLFDRNVFNLKYHAITDHFDYTSSLSIEGMYHHQKLPLFIDDDPDKLSHNAYLTSLFEPRAEGGSQLLKFIRANGRYPLLKQVCPHGKFLFVIRNPVDVVNSSLALFSFFGDDFHKSDYPRFVEEVNRLYNANISLSSKKENRGEGEQRVEREALYWYYMNRFALESFAAMDDKPLVICYESFIADKEKTIRQVCEYLEIPFQKQYVSLIQKTVGPSIKEVNFTTNEFNRLKTYLSKYTELLTQFQIENDFNPLAIINKYADKTRKNPRALDVLVGKNTRTLINHYSRTLHHLANQARQSPLAMQPAGKVSTASTDKHYDLQLSLNNIETLHLLGKVALQNKNYDLVITLFKKAIQLDDTIPFSYIQLGHALKEKGQLTEAADCYQKAISLKGESAATYDYENLLNILTKLDQLAEIRACYQQALHLHPNNDKLQDKFSGTLEKHARSLRARGMIHQAVDYFRAALEINPDLISVHSDLLLTLHYRVDYDPATIFAEHKRFNEQHALPLAKAFDISRVRNESLKSAKLRIGYLSQDFRDHGLICFFEGFLAHHNHEQFEVFCYHNNKIVDEGTYHLQQYADQWVDCVELSDNALAEKIQEDHIDILVDLMGHTGNNRLGVMARKPAPVQVTYLGYSDTTGLTAIDYRITDNYADPRGIAEPLSSETLIRIPNSYFCYHPSDQSVSINALPALENGYITFSSFNVYPKLSPDILTLWAQILQAVPHSKLLIKVRHFAEFDILVDDKTRQYYEKELARFGIDANRLIMIGHVPKEDYFQTYQQVDIALDSYPYNGATTTCDTLWMGIPVVTLVGQTHVSRMGLSILSTIDLTELVAHTPEDYVKICVQLANDRQKLQQLRSEIRAKMQASSLMDGTTFTRYLEANYQEMWDNWCAKSQVTQSKS